MIFFQFIWLCTMDWTKQVVSSYSIIATFFSIYHIALKPGKVNKAVIDRTIRKKLIIMLVLFMYKGIFIKTVINIEIYKFSQLVRDPWILLCNKHHSGKSQNYEFSCVILTCITLDLFCICANCKIYSGKI